MDSNDCYDRPHCIENSAERKKELFFCCCDGNMCNQNFTWDPHPTSSSKPGIQGIYLLFFSILDELNAFKY